MIKAVLIDSGGYSYTFDYSYDENGNLIKEVFTNSDGGSETTDYTYDQNGNMIKESRTPNRGKTETCEYVYDENGYKISQVRYDSFEKDSREFTTKLVFLPENSAKATKNVYSVLGLLK